MSLESPLFVVDNRDFALIYIKKSFNYSLSIANYQLFRYICELNCVESAHICRKR